MLVVSFPDSAPLARSIARKKKARFAPLTEHDFPDGESLIVVPRPGERVVVVAQLHRPNPKVLPLLFALGTLRELGVKSITLVVPYMPYMRQDIRFHPGEAVSNRLFATLLSRYADRVVTIDPHLHRTHKMTKLFPKGVRLSAIVPIADFIKARYPHALIIGPDEESFQWAESVAKLVRTTACVLLKKRFGDEHVRITHVKEYLHGRTVVIVDDIISSGHTMIEVVKQAKQQRAKEIVCIGVHGIFAQNADKRIERLGARLITTDSIPHRSNRIDLAPLIAGALHGTR